MDPNKANIIITGSSGLIGSPLCAMLGVTYTAVGFDRAGSPYPPIEVECVSVDLTADDRIRRALARVRFAYGPRLASVIHLAAYYNFSGEPSPLYDDITVRGTERLLRALHAMQFEVEQFIFSSTMLVHAPSRPGERISEESPWLLGHLPHARWNSLAVGALVLACSLVKGNRTHQFGGGWSSLWKDMPPDGRSRRG